MAGRGNRKRSHCHLVHHKSHMDYRENEPGPQTENFTPQRPTVCAHSLVGTSAAYELGGAG
jgi:hypothetical protein